PPDPSVTPTPCRAPWFFCGIQELAVHLPTTLAGRGVPLFLVIGLVVVPFVTRSGTVGRYDFRGRGVAVLIFLTLWGSWFLLIGAGFLMTTSLS
ncbi:MAG: hypothetical protein Q4C47_06735, partial [Planctomycetia bacterium]|nr:hypothetical protein [Planctomycetia bacterium]